MKYSDLKNKNAQETYEILNDLKKKQFMLRFQIKAGMGQSAAVVRECRRDIARVNTRLTELKN